MLAMVSTSRHRAIGEEGFESVLDGSRERRGCASGADHNVHDRPAGLGIRAHELTLHFGIEPLVVDVAHDSHDCETRPIGATQADGFTERIFFGP